MDNSATQDGSQKFSRREWLFLIAILLGTEYYVFSMSHSLLANQDIVNYVSFASAIVSILLAVIAIFYSFIQGEGQQKTSGAIANQIDSLKSASFQLTQSKEQLKVELDRVSVVTNKLDELHVFVGGGFARMDEVLLEFKRDIQAQSKTPASATSPPFKAGTLGRKISSEEKADLAMRLLTSSTYEADLMAYALHLWHTKGNNKLSWVNFISNHYAAPMLSIADPAKQTYAGYLDVGFQILSMLSSVELVQLPAGEPLIMSPELLAYVKGRAPKIKSDDYEKIKKNVPVIEASFL